MADNDKERIAYATSFKAYKDAERKLAEIKKQLKRVRKNEEFTRFQYEEIASANLQDGLQEELEAEAKLLRTPKILSRRCLVQTIS